MRQRLFDLVYWIVLAGAASWTLYRRFTNIDMTNGRLFVTFWPEWAIVIALVLTMHYLRVTRWSGE